MGLQRIMRSTVIDAPIERVWAVLRDFNSHAQWHPAIADSRIEDGRRPDEVGCVRAFRLKDGGALREQLILLSDRDHRLSYNILDSTVPLGSAARLDVATGWPRCCFRPAKPAS